MRGKSVVRPDHRRPSRHIKSRWFEREIDDGYGGFPRRGCLWRGGLGLTASGGGLRHTRHRVSFGGHGAHYCIGANLARMEIKLIFNEIADQMPNIAKLAEPQRLRSGWINGVKALQVSYRG